MALLEVRTLKTYFFTGRGIIKAVDEVSFEVEKGKVLGIFGESGGGKSVTALSILGLVPSPGRITGGQIMFKGRNLTQASKQAMRSIRGNEIAMIFQDPMTSLTPFFTIGNQIVEAIQQHREVSKGEANEIAIHMLKIANLPEPETLLRVYPFQLSGGMRQRAMIAMALSCSPDLLLADEPTTALDVTTQAQIMLEMRELQKRLGMAVIIITHDLGVISELADEVIVMYAGQVMERAPVETLVHHPGHPYTKALVKSVPTLKTAHDRLEPIPGLPPDLLDLPIGCPFRPRCPYAQIACEEDKPQLTAFASGHWIACHFARRLTDL